MNKKPLLETYLERQKEFLNEVSEESTYFDEIQTGPMEEGTLMEFKFYPKKFKKYMEDKKRSSKVNDN